MNSPDFNIPQDKLDSMLKTASQKLGTTPEKLKKELQSGNFDALKSNPMLSSVLNNPEKMNQLLKNPQLQEILKRLNGNG